MAARKSRAGYDGKIAGLYDLEDTIGKGHFAVVKLARHVFTGEKVAVKVIDKTKLDEVSRSHLFQEVRCMKLVQHPNVVRLYEVIDTQTKLYLILELGDGGDMYDYIMKHTGGLEEKVAKRYFRQIVEAISYCHKLHVVHRDLKPENVVFFEKLGLVKLTDFGFSNMFAPGKKLETSCGSLAYSAPEILLGDSYDAPAVDVWSLGVILYMLVVGSPPFQEANDSETLTMIMDCKYLIPKHISNSCKDLISRMLQRDPANRASLMQIIQHPWLNDGDLTPISSYAPLIIKEMISEEDHSYVVQKMVEGKIAAREEILHSLEKNSYDHITATYYLLIERRLRKHQQHDFLQQQQQQSSGSLRKQSAPSPSRPAKPHLEPLMLSPRKQKELKKTKTAPLAPLARPYTEADTPAILVSPPVEETSTSPGPYFVKSLTTSMTLDRRKNAKKVLPQPASGSVSPRTALRKLSAPARDVSSLAAVPSSSQTATSQPSLLAAGTGTKKQRSTGVSKIALLSSFFERKAKQEAEGEKGGPKFSLMWLTGRNRRPNFVRQRILETLETPCSPTAEPLPQQGLGTGLQGTGAENADSGTSHYVQSLVSPPGTHPSTSTAASNDLQTTPSPTDSNLLLPPGPIRKCSLIKEESLEEYDEEDDDDMEPSTIKPVKSLESLDDLQSCSSHTMYASVPAPTPTPTLTLEPVNPRRPLKSVCSSPQLLNQIHEENESEDEDDFVPLKLSAPRRCSHHHHHSSSHRENSSASPEILRKYEQRKKRRGTQRGTSCSSSDASDTDDTEGRSRKDKLRHKFVHRRDSSDHSSDTDGPGGNLGGNGRIGSGSSGGSRGSHTQNGSGGGGGGSGGGGGGGGGGGSCNDKDNKKGSSEGKGHNNNNNNKNNTNNQKNSKYYGGGSGSKGSLTDASLKLLTRKLSDISNGVGALLTDCRGSDCDNDSPLHKPTSPHHPDLTGSAGSGGFARQSRSTSLKSNVSNKSALLSDHSVSSLSDRYSQGPLLGPRSPVQYLGQSTDCDSICGRRQSFEFSEISNCFADAESLCSVNDFPGKGSRKLGGHRACRGVDVNGSNAHPGCKPTPNGVPVVPVKSKCCSVV